jgi:hypothetical protein
MRLYNEELYDLYSLLYLGDQFKVDMLGGALGTQCGEKKCMQGFCEETSGRDTTWKVRCRWEFDIEVDAKERN